ncbi:MAG: Spy0128 family protein, partial [Coriobacteriales bacterium]
TSTAKVALKTEKSIDGRGWQTGETHTFDLTATGGAPLRTSAGSKTVLSQTVDSSNAVASFPELVFEYDDLAVKDASGKITGHEAKSFTYKIHERVPAGATATIGGSTVKYSDASNAQKAAADGKWAYQGVVFAADQTVTVNLSDNGDGTLKVTYGTSGSETAPELEFTNSYTASGNATLQVQKTISGRVWKSGDSFTFMLMPAASSVANTDGSADPAPLLAAAPIREVKSDDTTVSKTSVTTTATSSAAVKFPKIAFTQDDLANVDGSYSAKTFNYTVREKAPDDAVKTIGGATVAYKDATEAQKAEGGFVKDGITYAADQTVTVNVSDNGNGTLKVTYGASGTSDASPVVFENKYAPTPVTAKLQAEKIGDAGLTFPEGGYYFTLSSTRDSTPMPSNAVDKSEDDIGRTAQSTSGATALGQTVDFGEITYDKVGDYYYTISETLPTGVDPKHPVQVIGGKPVVFNTEEHSVHVSVTDPNLDGKLQASVSYDGKTGAGASNAPQVKNRLARDGSFLLSTSKQYTGQMLKDGQFSYKLYWTDSTYDYTDVSHIVYRPVVGGQQVDYIGRTSTDSEGNLTADVQLSHSYLHGEKTATFYYVAVEDNAGKTIDGVTYGADSLRAKVDVEEVEAVDSDGAVNYNIRPVKITYTKSGSPDEEYVETYTYDAEGKATVATSGSKPVFSNSYSAKGSASVSVSKTIVGREWADDDSFSFTLTGGGVANSSSTDTSTPSLETAPLRTEGTGGELASNDSLETSVTSSKRTSGFEDLVFTQDDLANADGTYSDKTFTYVVRENAPDDAVKTIDGAEVAYKDATDAQKAEGGFAKDGITYAADQTVTVNVSDNGNGTLGVTYGANATSTLPALEFENDYQIGDTQIPVSVTKEITGRVWIGADSFEFKMTPVGGSPIRTAREDGTLESHSELTATSTRDNHDATFPLVFTSDDLGDAAEATFNYKLVEVVPDDAVNDSGTTWVEADAATRASSMWVKNGVVYSTAEHDVSVTISDSGNGGLSSEVSYDGGENLVVINPYSTRPPQSESEEYSAVLNARKSIPGMDLSGGEFEVTAKLADGTVAYTMSNDGDGLFSTGEFTLDIVQLENLVNAGNATLLQNDDGLNVWTIVYTLSETLPEDDDSSLDGVQSDGITYDETVHTATLTITDDGEGRLVPSVTYDADSTEPPTFTNKLVPGAATVSLSANKVLTGGELSDGQFSFTLTDQDGKSVTVKNKADGTIALPTLTFDSVGTYTYTLSEVDAGEKGYTYDKTEYEITVDVTEGDTAYQTAVSISNGNSNVGEDEMTFHNTYNGPKTGIPKTGDSLALPVVATILIGISTVFFVVTLRRRRRSDSR